MKDLLTVAASYGVTVHGAHLIGEKIGKYVPSLKRVYFDLSLTSADRRSVIGHELGHVHYGHDHDSPANERLADAYAATLLVEPEWYAELEAINHDAEWIAEEMNVAPWTIVDYRTYCLQRLGSYVYARPKMGARQWRHRAVAL